MSSEADVVGLAIEGERAGSESDGHDHKPIFLDQIEKNSIALSRDNGFADLFAFRAAIPDTYFSARPPELRCSCG